MFNVKFSYEGAIFHVRNTNRVPCIGEHVIIEGWVEDRFVQGEVRNSDILQKISNECLFTVTDVCACYNKDSRRDGSSIENYEIEVKPWEDEE